MVIPLLAKLYGDILETKINIWLESHGKRVKCHARFHGCNWTMGRLVTLRIIAKECCIKKINIFCCFVDFRKSCVPMPRSNPSNRFEERKSPFELIVIAIGLYMKVIMMFKNRTQARLSHIRNMFWYLHP